MDEGNDQVRRFINGHISSVAQLEILLLLQTNPQQKWTVEQIVHELRTGVAGTQQEVNLLSRSGLLQQEGPDRYFYSPSTPELHAAAVAVAQAYLIRRVTVIGLIFAKPPDSLRAFSDAFRLRKEPPDEPRS